jgi:hypothetical protein
MEDNLQVIDGIINDKTGLHVNTATKNYLNEIRKWTKFFAVLGFVMIGALILLALFLPLAINGLGRSSAMPAGFSLIFSIVYFLFAALYFFPALYLLQFSNHLKTALYSNNESELEQAFKYLKSHFKFIGIMILVILGFYAAAIAIGLVAGAAALV